MTSPLDSATETSHKEAGIDFSLRVSWKPIGKWHKALILLQLHHRALTW